MYSISDLKRICESTPLGSVHNESFDREKATAVWEQRNMEEYNSVFEMPKRDNDLIDQLCSLLNVKRGKKNKKKKKDKKEKNIKTSTKRAIAKTKKNKKTSSPERRKTSTTKRKAPSTKTSEQDEIDRAIEQSLSEQQNNTYDDDNNMQTAIQQSLLDNEHAQRFNKQQNDPSYARNQDYLKYVSNLRDNRSIKSITTIQYMGRTYEHEN